MTEVEKLRAALNDAAYALFQIKRMVPKAIPEFAAEAHRKACKVLGSVPPIQHGAIDSTNKFM